MRYPRAVRYLTPTVALIVGLMVVLVPPLPGRASPPEQPSLVPCADFTGDGVVQSDDIRVIAEAWRTPPSDPYYDDRFDLAQTGGYINVRDIMLASAQLGQRCGAQPDGLGPSIEAPPVQPVVITRAQFPPEPPVFEEDEVNQPPRTPLPVGPFVQRTAVPESIIVPRATATPTATPTRTPTATWTQGPIIRAAPTGTPVPGATPAAVAPAANPPAAPGAAVSGTAPPPRPQPAADGVQVKLNRTVPYSGGGVPPDPSGASAGNVIVTTVNSNMVFSTNGGSSWTTINPTTLFPNNVDGGFCCDQLVHYSPVIDRFIWVLQYWRSGANQGTAGAGEGRYRVAVASPDAIRNCAGQCWTYWDLTAGGVFGLRSQWFDYPDLALGARNAYLTADINLTTYNASGAPVPGFNNQGVIVIRMPLEELRTGSTLHMRFFTRNPPLVLIRATQNTGSRAFFAHHNSTSQVRVIRWDESSTTYYWNDINVASWNSGLTAANTPDGVNFLAFGFPGNGILGATRVRARGELWYAWNSAGDPANRPGGQRYPNTYIEVVRINDQSMGVINQYAVWNRDHAFAYPALITNADSDVGMSFVWGGGTFYANHGVALLANTAPADAVATAFSNVGGPARWGDYLSLRRHGAERSLSPRLFSTLGYVNRSTTTGSTVEPHFVIFGRQSVPYP